MASAHDFTFTTIDNKPLDLKAFAGKPVLVVNVASFCGLTPQYTDLQKLHETYGAKGLVVLGVPSNDFGAQEPKTEPEIAKFCETIVRRDLPDDLQAEGDRARCPRALPVDRRRSGRGRRAQVELPQIPDRQGRQPARRLASRVRPRLPRSRGASRRPALGRSGARRRIAVRRRRGTSRSSAGRCSCCSASSDSCRRACRPVGSVCSRLWMNG